MKRIYNYHISFWKGVACIFVLLLHCNVENGLGKLINIFSRFAVPFFFMVSGYYAEDKIGLHDNNYIVRKIKRNIIIYAIGVCIYFSVFAIESILINNMPLKEFVKYYINKAAIILFFVGNKTVFGEHLWFISALIYYYIIIFIIVNLNLNRINILMKNIYFCSLMFLMGYFVRLFFIHHKINVFGLNLDRVELYRNWLFTGIPFIGIGRFLRCNEEKVFKKYLIGKISFGLIIGGAIIQLLEYTILSALLEIYIGTYFFTIGLFIICLYFPNQQKNSCVQILGQKLFPYVYVLHPMVIRIFKMLGLNPANIWSICGIIIVSIALSFLIMHLNEKFNPPAMFGRME